MSVFAKPKSKVVWILTWLLVLIGLAAAGRRGYVLAVGIRSLGIDDRFAAERMLTFLHIIPASLLMLLIPFQFAARIRKRYPRVHRWSGRLWLVLAVVVVATALRMEYTRAIGGANEIAVITLYSLLFVAFAGAGFWNIRRGNVAAHRQWMLRASGVALGVATTRPIVGAFFATRRLAPQEFFGIAFWLGFTITLIAAEAWIHYSHRADYA